MKIPVEALGYNPNASTGLNHFESSTHKTELPVPYSFCS